MTFSAIIRAMTRSPLTTELTAKLKHQHLSLSGLARLPKGLVTTALAHCQHCSLLLVTPTLEEAGRWVAQLEAMGWSAVHFYPTSEGSPYEPFDPEPEMTWGQLQVLAELVKDSQAKVPIAIVTTQRALQPHLPPVELFRSNCHSLQTGMELDLDHLSLILTKLGYERVPLVETEGQWSRRGDIVDVFPVSVELPVRLEWFGDQLDKIREFDPGNQRSLDDISQLFLTPTNLTPFIVTALTPHGVQEHPLTPTVMVESEGDHAFNPGGMSRYLGCAFPQPASILDYIPLDTLIAFDEIEQCQSHGDRWYRHTVDHWEEVRTEPFPPSAIHRTFWDCLNEAQMFDCLYLSELVTTPADILSPPPQTFNFATRPINGIPNQFGRLAETLRSELHKGFTIWLISAQPSRSVSLLQDHDCPAQFISNPSDYPTIEKLQSQRTPIALKYSGQAELEGFILPTLRTVVVTDREFYGQHALATPGFIRKRRRAHSKQVDPNQLQPGDFVVHRHHGIGQFMKLESLTVSNETREYLVLQYADGLLRVVADQVGNLSRFRGVGDQRPDLSKMAGKAWERTKSRVQKAIKKLAVDLLQLYAQRAQQQGFSFPVDTPWQQELEDSFPYQPTSDQLKATQEVKRDMESDRPMDRLVCGDVGFGKTEVAIRAIFKAITGGKQVALLAPTTILTQQHYHTLKERFAPYPIQVGLLNRFRTAEERKDIQQRLMTGELDVVVGTHQLLGKGVQFRDLGLLVVDEEQRFGVNQKEKIKSLKTQVDVLTLSATPIPRTLYMALSGVREMSLITTPPPSRRPIKTHLAAYDLEIVRTAIRQELDRGGQVFYVVPRVEGIEEISAKIREMIPGIGIAIAHGQMPEGELESTMLAFSTGEVHILVCTTIIESGLDIPRVNTILVEDAQKFGLSQLYQLRGRVGRAGIQAHAWLFYPSKHELSDLARERLRAIQEFTQLGSGYQLAVRDMEIRGVGNLLGAEQSGQMDAIGFDLYMEMLQDAIKEVRGQEIPQVDDTQIDLHLTAFIPADYIPDLEQKMTAYRSIATAHSKAELAQIATEWGDRYGSIPTPALQLIRVMELKQIAKKLGFSRIKPDGKQHIVLETPMEEPAWNLLKTNLPHHLHPRWVYGAGKVIVRGLGMLTAHQQLDNLINWLGTMENAIPMDKRSIEKDI